MRSVGCACLLVAGLVGASAAFAQAPKLDNMDIVLKSVPDGPVAKVNDTYIGRGAFVRLYLSELNRIAESSPNGVPDGARVKLALWCIATVIEDELLYQEAARKGVDIRSEAVDDALDSRIERIRASMEKQSNKSVNEADVIARLGFSSREELQKDVERVLIVDEMRNRIVKESGATVSDADVAKVYEEEHDAFVRPSGIHLRQIFISSNNPDAAQKAQEALSRVKSGQSFEGVAKAMSQSPDRNRGGDMGLVPVEQLPPFMTEQAMKLKPGEVSEVFSSEFGHHIIQMVSKEEGDVISLNDAAPRIRQALLSQKGESIVREYCDALIRDQDEVKVFLELEKNLALDPKYSEMQLEN